MLLLGIAKVKKKKSYQWLSGVFVVFVQVSLNSNVVRYSTTLHTYFLSVRSRKDLVIISVPAHEFD